MYSALSKTKRNCIDSFRDFIANSYSFRLCVFVLACLLNFVISRGVGFCFRPCVIHRSLATFAAVFVLRVLCVCAGIFVLGEKLGMDATEDIRILVLLWKMGCREKPAQMSKQEWMQGCAKLQVDTWKALQEKTPSLDTGFLETQPFKEFYKFCFQFNRQGTHRSLDKELVVGLLKMVLKDRVAADRLESFCAFLEANEQYTKITLDQWTSFLDFCQEVPDLSSYDESTSAWPVLIDEYVEHMETLLKDGANGGSK